MEKITMVMKIIGLAGRAGAGKSTVASIMTEVFGYVQISLAQPLRDGLKAMMGLTDFQLDNPEEKNNVIEWIGRSPRELMQTLGTGWGRESIADDIWLRVADIQINKLKKASPCMHVYGIVIPDVRFENSADWVRKKGGTIIHVTRKSGCQLTGNCSTHVSEQAIPIHENDIVLRNDSGLDDLYEEIDFHLKSIN